ncbi:kinase-like domain-containing protein [Rhizophagus irregularis DAOM 181602=DAOM 197198]|nr:kinase-like domain-containing protein [Rhizophagus irregularis DAOM 181602=DAOM 197198]POG65992.1 kinase-like domain-containing protein [Rhizophagus irregularis DAOM 181602=DAOM 197198]|eukprot:XP_025172858.1 kinase-like domain-containing protein [Rhizophagus irregularis DAOM 181602=DAOM 197198]
MDNDLNKYLQQNHNQLTWKERINIICDIIKALYEIHEEKAIHRDLHSGNILYLQSANLWCISDLGFCGPVDQPLSSIYGNLPYIAPEVVIEKKQGFASDIYSIAMLMWEISSGKPPFNNCEHDYVLAMNIIGGMRPEIVLDTPLEYKQLMEQCWDADPLKRPDIDRLYNKIFEIRNLYYQNGSNKSYNQPFHKYNINLYQFFQSNKSKSFKTDYGSRLITSKFYNFEHLSSLKPKNATEGTKSYSLYELLYLKIVN